LEFSKNEKEKKSHKNETIFSVFVKKKKNNDICTTGDLSIFTTAEYQ